MHRLAGPARGEAQIFVDDVVVARKVGVCRRSHPCHKLSSPVVAGVAPWETADMDPRVYLYGTVLEDAERGGYRMWYMRNPNRVLHAISVDGICWECADNHCQSPPLHSPSVVVDHQDPDPRRRYKMLGCAKLPAGRGYSAAYSSDGLTWQLYAENPILSGSDTCTLSLDPATGEYLAFHKLYHEYRGQRRRLVYVSTSSDMQAWSEPRLAMAPDEIDDARTQGEGGLFSEFYNMSAFAYGGQWLGLVTHFRYSGSPLGTGPQQSPHDGPIDVQLVHSRDGLTWHRCEDRTPVIPNGPHAYDAGCVLGVANQPVHVGDSMWIYYTAITTTHGGYLPEKQCTIARGAWRRDGWVSLDADAEGGTVETVTMRLPGDSLVVNADAAGGVLMVEVADEAGAPLPGYGFGDCQPIRQDGVRHAVRWRERTTLPSEIPVRLRFGLESASLYSYLVA
jgi:hypothetical protein